MTDSIFALRAASPMLIKDEGEAFDSPDYLYELKLDGIRCLAYLEPGMAELRNKRNKNVTSLYPELGGIQQQVKGRCILDGELVALTGGKPDFAKLQRRSLMSDPFHIELMAKSDPVRLVAFDILYLDGRLLTGLPLLRRKDTLSETVKEDEQLALARFIPDRGVEFFRLAAERELEGVVAKRKQSLYYFGRRTNDWIKFKKLHDDDFVICGYVPGENGQQIKSILLGAYDGGRLVYQGHVALGITSQAAALILKQAAACPRPCPFEHIKEPDAIWFEPRLVCTVKYMMRTTESGLLRQPVFKGLALDKRPEECRLNKARADI